MPLYHGKWNQPFLAFFLAWAMLLGCSWSSCWFFSVPCLGRRMGMSEAHFQRQIAAPAAVHVLAAHAAPKARCSRSHLETTTWLEEGRPPTSRQPGLDVLVSHPALVEDLLPHASGTGSTAQPHKSIAVRRYLARWSNKARWGCFTT